MTDLVGFLEFLRARLDEDESEAKAAIDRAGSGDWRYRPDADYVSWVETDEDATAAINREVWWPLVTEAQSYVGDGIHDELGRHIARHDPARVLRGVEAKRRAVDEYAYWVDRALNPGPYPQPDQGGRFETAATMVKALAAEWSDHPDYREEWRP